MKPYIQRRADAAPITQGIVCFLLTGPAYLVYAIRQRSWWMFFGPFLVAFGMMGAVPSNVTKDNDLFIKYTAWALGGVTAGALCAVNKQEAQKQLDASKKEEVSA